jgi:hypothetical protein
MRKALLVAISITIVAALYAGDEQPLDVRTGLWQVEYHVKYSGLPPQMQAMMDQMTAQQKSAMGLQTPKNFKICVTEKNRNTSWTEGSNDCRWKVLKSTTTDLELHGTSCSAGKNQGAASDVDLKFHVLDREDVRASLHGTATENGMNATLDGDYTGKWVSATCPAGMK